MNLTDIKFRNKRKSWIFYNMLLTGNTIDGVEKKIYIGHYYKDPYIRGFLNDVFLRPSCSSCKFTTIERTSDFTIADWWGGISDIMEKVVILSKKEFLSYLLIQIRLQNCLIIKSHMVYVTEKEQRRRR